MNHEQIDQHVRSALQPSPEAVRLVVRAALVPKTSSRARTAFWVATTAAGSLLAALWLLRTPQHAPDAGLRLTNVGDTVVMQQGAGEVWLVGEGRPHDRLPSGTVIVHSPGERR